MAIRSKLVTNDLSLHVRPRLKLDDLLNVSDEEIIDNHMYNTMVARRSRLAQQCANNELIDSLKEEIKIIYYNHKGSLIFNATSSRGQSLKGEVSPGRGKVLDMLARVQGTFPGADVVSIKKVAQE